MLSFPGSFDITGIQHLGKLLINVQRKIQQTATGLTTANRNMPYLLVMNVLDILQKQCSTTGCQYYTVPLYSSNMSSRVTFLSRNNTVRHSLTLHLFKAKNSPIGSFHTGLLILEVDPADSAFYNEVYSLAFSTLHADSILYIADLPMNARFASSQLNEVFCARSMLGTVPGVIALEGHAKLSLSDLRESFNNILEGTIVDILSGLLEQELISLNKDIKTCTSFLLIYVPTTDTILDDSYITSMSPHLYKLSETLTSANGSV